MHASTRYTPPVTSEMKAPKPWIPVLMLVLLGLGMVVIIVRNLGLVDGNWPLLVGLACIPRWAVHRHQVALATRTHATRELVGSPALSTSVNLQAVVPPRRYPQGGG